ADSAHLLAAAVRLVVERGWRIGNVDASIIAQSPRLAAHIPAMCRRIAEVLSVEPDRVNVKARTGERLDPVGRGECIEAMAGVPLERHGGGGPRGGLASRGRPGTLVEIERLFVADRGWLRVEHEAVFGMLHASR